MLSCQVLLMASSFMSNDCYANYAQHIRAKFDVFMEEERRYCSMLNETDLYQIQQRIIASGMLTVAEINTFFGRK